MSIEDHPHSGHPSTSRTDENVENIREQINKDRQYTIDEISEATGMSWSSCQQILTMDLNMRRIATKFVPHLLTQDQKAPFDFVPGVEKSDWKWPKLSF